MKKILVVLAAAVLVLSFAGAAFAIHAEIPAETQAIVAKSSTQITLGGEIRVRGWYYNNLGQHDAIATPSTTSTGSGIPVESNSKANYDTRVRLTLDAVVSPNVSGRIMLETGSAQTDTWTWSNLNRKPDALLSFQEAWILYTGSGLFGFNSGLKIGHMPLRLSEGQFFDNTQFGDDAIVFFMDPTKEIHIGLLAVKFAGDGNRTAYNPILPFGQGSFMNSTPANGTAYFPLGFNTGSGSSALPNDDLDGYVALMTYKIDPKNTIGINYTYLNRNDIGFKLQNLGIHGNGSTGNFGYAAEVDFQFGQVFDTSWNHDDDFDYEGWAILLKGNYKMNNWNFRASFAYGSGDDDPFDSSIKTFIPFVGSVQNYTLIYDYLATTTAGGTATGLANTTYYNLGLDYAATKDLSFSLDGYILRASDTWDNVSKSAGWEIDAKMKYQIAKNLTYQVDLGYFDPGSFYDDTLDEIAHAAFGPQNPYYNHCIRTSDTKGMTVLRNMLTLSF